MLGFQFEQQKKNLKKSFLNYEHIVLELCGLEQFSLGCLIPTWLLEEPETKERAEEGA